MIKISTKAKIIIGLIILFVITSLWMIRYNAINHRYSSISVSTVLVKMNGKTLSNYDWGIVSLKHDIQTTSNKSNNRPTINDNVTVIIKARKKTSFPNETVCFVNEYGDPYQLDIFNKKVHSNYMSEFSNTADRELSAGNNTKILNYFGQDISKKQPPHLVVLKHLSNGSYIKYSYA